MTAPENFGLSFEDEVVAKDARRSRRIVDQYIEKRRTVDVEAGATIFYGSSTVRLWRTLVQDFPHRRTIRIGIPSASAVDLRNWYPSLVGPLQPAFLVLYAGVMDAAAGTPSDEVVASLASLCESARLAQPLLPIAIVSLLAAPSRARVAARFAHVNDGLRRHVATSPKISLIDAAASFAAVPERERPALFSRSQVHLSRHGYALLASCVRKALPLLA